MKKRQSKPKTPELYVLPPDSWTMEAARPATREEIEAAYQAIKRGEKPPALYTVTAGVYTIEDVKLATNREIRDTYEARKRPH